MQAARALPRGTHEPFRLPVRPMGQHRAVKRLGTPSDFDECARQLILSSHRQFLQPLNGVLQQLRHRTEYIANGVGCANASRRRNPARLMTMEGAKLACWEQTLDTANHADAYRPQCLKSA